MCAAVFPREKKEEILPFITEEGSGKETVEEPQELVLKPFPIELNPTANAQATNNPLPVALYPEPMYIQSTPAAQFTPEAPAPKAESIPSVLPVQYFKKLVAFVQIFATTSKKMAATHTAWHSGWFECWFGFGAPEPQHF